MLAFILVTFSADGPVGSFSDQHHNVVIELKSTVADTSVDPWSAGDQIFRQQEVAKQGFIEGAFHNIKEWFMNFIGGKTYKGELNKIYAPLWIPDSNDYDLSSFFMKDLFDTNSVYFKEKILNPDRSKQSSILTTQNTLFKKYNIFPKGLARSVNWDIMNSFRIYNNRTSDNITNMYFLKYLPEKSILFSQS
jgi:hypothetical protein